jgi:hypothetical protein
LADVDGVPLTASHLAKGQIHDPAHICPKQEHVFASCFDNNLSWFAVSDYFDRFIDGNSLSVQPGPDQYSMSERCCLQRIR